MIRRPLHAVEPALVVTCPGVVRGGLAAAQLKRVLDYLEENLAEPMTVADVAAVAGLSPSHFNRAFKRSFDLPVHLYVMRRRVELAQRLMIDTSESLGTIAFACGMSDQSHLTRWFRRVLGETPNSWRRAHRGGPPIALPRPPSHAAAVPLPRPRGRFLDADTLASSCCPEPVR